MYFPQEIFNIINEYNGVNNYFPKNLINFLRYMRVDDLISVVEHVLHKKYRFTHKQMSVERRQIVLKDVFTTRSCKDIFIKLMNQNEIYQNIHSLKNYNFRVGDEIIWFKGHGLTYCGIIKKINHKSLKLDCYDYEIKNAEHWDGRQVPYRYWKKNIINKHISITDRIDNIYVNNTPDINRENFIRIREYQ